MGERKARKNKVRSCFRLISINDILLEKIKLNLWVNEAIYHLLHELSQPSKYFGQV